MRIMSERRFQEELEKEDEIYQREHADSRMMEIHQRIDAKICDLLDLRCKDEVPADKRATTTEVQK